VGNPMYEGLDKDHVIIEACGAAGRAVAKRAVHRMHALNGSWRRF
jgi:hypothetical protein